MNQPAICILSVVPIRAEASDKAEIISQLLFGELVDIIEMPKRQKNWCKISCDWDSYEGYMDPRQLKLLTLEEYERYQNDHALCLDITSVITNSNHFLPITLGATLPCFDGLNCQLSERHYTFGGQAARPSSLEATPEIIIKLARRYLFAPYLWGGRSPFGIDCSGFTQMVFKMVGMRLRRDASQQIEQGRLIDFTDQAQLADLAFFDNEKGRITHVGIVMEGGMIIHASGQVRIDKFDHYGIFNEERGIYTHKLRLIKRFLPDIPHLRSIDKLEELLEIPENQLSIF